MLFGEQPQHLFLQVETILLILSCLSLEFDKQAWLAGHQTPRDLPVSVSLVPGPQAYTFVPIFFFGGGGVLGITQILMLGRQGLHCYLFNPGPPFHFLFKFIHFDSMCVGVLTACVYAPWVWLVPTEARKWSSDPLKLVLPMDMNCHEDAENWISVLLKSN